MGLQSSCVDTTYSHDNSLSYLSCDHFMIHDPPQTMDFKAKVAYYGDLVTLPGFQNVHSPTSTLFTADVGGGFAKTEFMSSFTGAVMRQPAQAPM
jgi:hypothetical protein